MPDQTPDEQSLLLRSLDAIPLFDGVDRGAIHSRRLGGLTNLVFLVEVPGSVWVVRVPGAGTETYIDRAVEAHNAGVAARAGVSPELVHFGSKDGLMVTRFLAGTTTMSPTNFKERAGSPRRAAEVFRRIHGATESFHYRFELFAKIDEYLAHLDRREARYPDGYHDVVSASAEVKQVLARNPTTLAPSHCDPLAENFLDDGDRMWLVDWEYSGMNDPIWDLADLAVEASFDEAQDAELLHAYCGGQPPSSVLGRYEIYKAMCDLLWTLWGLIQHENHNPAEDFWKYSVDRLARCRARMSSRDFGSRLAQIG